MKQIVFALLLICPFVGFSQPSAYLNNTTWDLEYVRKSKYTEGTSDTTSNSIYTKDNWKGVLSVEVPMRLSINSDDILTITSIEEIQIPPIEFTCQSKFIHIMFFPGYAQEYSWELKENTLTLIFEKAQNETVTHMVCVYNKQ